MDGDLDPLKGMYWAWSSGFINFKLEGSCLNCGSEKEFTYHIGGFIAPYQSFQTASIPLNQKIHDFDIAIGLQVNVGNLFVDKFVHLRGFFTLKNDMRVVKIMLTELIIVGRILTVISNTFITMGIAISV